MCWEGRGEKERGVCVGRGEGVKERGVEKLS